jgi:hypothetical protein
VSAGLRWLDHNLYILVEVVEETDEPIDREVFEAATQQRGHLRLVDAKPLRRGRLIQSFALNYFCDLFRR